MVEKSISGEISRERIAAGDHFCDALSFLKFYISVKPNKH